MLPVVRTDAEWQAVVFDEKIVRPAVEDLAARLGLAGAGLRRYPGSSARQTGLASSPASAPRPWRASARRSSGVGEHAEGAQGGVGGVGDRAALSGLLA